MNQRTGWILAIVLAPLLVLAPILFTGNTIGPFDQISSMAPWFQKPSESAWDILQADGAIQFYVWRDLVFSSWRQGQLPAWNPYQFGGTPLLANSQSGALYPPHLAAAFLPTSIAISLLAWFHLALAGLGVYCLSRKLGANQNGAGFSAVAFTLSPFMISWTVLPSVISTCSYIPWILCFTVGIFQNHRPSSPLLAISIGLSILAGHLQFAFYGILSCVLLSLYFTVISLIKDKKFPVLPAAIAFGAAVLGVLLSSAHLLPVREYSQFSHRQGTATQEGYKAFTAGAVQPWEFVSIVAPGFMGTPGRAESAVSSDFPYPTYWPQFVKPGANYAESAIALGPAVLLGLFLLRRRLDWRAIGAPAFIAIVGFLLAAGTSLNTLLYFGIPGFSASGSPGRASVLFVLGACVVAGIALSQPYSEEPEKRDYIPVAFLGLVVLISFVLANNNSSLTPWIPGLQVTPQIATRFLEMIPMLLAAAIAAGFAWFLIVRKGHQIAGITVLIAVHIFISQIHIIPSGKVPDPVDAIPPKTAERYAFINGPWDFTRAVSAMMPPNTASIYKISDIAGYDSLIHRDTVEILREINSGEDPAPPTNGNILYVKKNFNLDALRSAGVTKIFAQSPVENPELDWQAIGSGAEGRQLYVAETGGPGLFGSPKNDAKIISQTPSQILFQASGAGRFIYRIRNLPGWKAEISGKETPLLPGPWLAVDLPEQLVEIKFTYTPPGLKNGLLLSLFAVICLVVWIPIAVRVQKNHDLADAKNHLV